MTATTRSKVWVLWLVLVVLSVGWVAACGLGLFYPTTGAVSLYTFHVQGRDEASSMADAMARAGAPKEKQLMVLESAVHFGELVLDDRDDIVHLASAGAAGLAAGALFLFLMLRARRQPAVTAAQRLQE